MDPSSVLSESRFYTRGRYGEGKIANSQITRKGLAGSFWASAKTLFGELPQTQPG